MNISEIIPLVVVFAMYTSAVVGAVWLVVLGDWEIAENNKNKNNMKNKKLQRFLFDTVFALVAWAIGTICAILIIKSIQG